MLIREINDTDYKNLSALAIQVWLHTYAKDGVRKEYSDYVLSKFTPDYFRDIHKAGSKTIYVALEYDHLVGFITVDMNSVPSEIEFQGNEIVTLYIQEYFQGKGIGKKLIEKAVQELKSSLWLSTWIHNTNAIEFYKHFGFNISGTTYFHLGDEKHENYILTYSIG